MAETRPSAIVQRPMPDDAIKDCTVAELLTEVIERARDRRGRGTPEHVADRIGSMPLENKIPDLAARDRELSIAVTLAEDCLTRHNKAMYIERGVFAITDAERIPEA